MKKLNLYHLFSSLSIFIFLSFPYYLSAQQILYGDSITLGNGVVRTWVQLNAVDRRELIGVSMTDGVLNNLPDTITRVFVLALPVPVLADDTTFNHVFLTWNPDGHGSVPPGAYLQPHFDFHFVMVKRAEREAVIPGPDPVFYPLIFRPLDYMTDFMAVPLRGVHWADSLAPEFNGGTFTKTLIYNFYRGKLFAFEPMITRAYLLTNPQDTIIPIKQPQAYFQTGRYPLEYSVTHNASNQTYNVVLQNLQLTELTLPVELSSFVSFVNDRNVNLNWTTTSEENNSGFEIERSIVNSEWSTVNFVTGHGNSNIPQNYSYEDKNLPSGKYNYRLKQIDYNGNFEYYDLQNEVVIGSPDNYSLSQNYPNPFNPSTVISYQLAVNSIASLKIYDVLGNEVATLVNEKQNAGYYSVDFNARDKHGYNFSSGVYFYKLAVDGNVIDTKRMMLLK